MNTFLLLLFTATFLPRSITKAVPQYQNGPEAGQASAGDPDGDSAAQPPFGKIPDLYQPPAAGTPNTNPASAAGEATDPSFHPVLDFDDLRRLDELAKADYACAVKVLKRSPPQSEDLEKRADPSDALFDGRAMVVNMGLAAFTTYANNQNGIGTRGLCGCSAVVIASKLGALVAHIPPNVQDAQETLWSIRYLFNEHRADLVDSLVYFFPPSDNGDNTGINVSYFQEGLKDYLLNNVGIMIQQIPYFRNDEGDARVGTVIVKLIDGAIKIWLNNNPIPTS